MAITSFQEASNEVVVSLFCHAYNCVRYTSCIMINMMASLYCYLLFNVESIQLDVEECEVPWGTMLYIIVAHTLL